MVRTTLNRLHCSTMIRDCDVTPWTHSTSRILLDAGRTSAVQLLASIQSNSWCCTVLLMTLLLAMVAETPRPFYLIACYSNGKVLYQPTMIVVQSNFPNTNYVVVSRCWYHISWCCIHCWSLHFCLFLVMVVAAAGFINPIFLLALIQDSKGKQ